MKMKNLSGKKILPIESFRGINNSWNDKIANSKAVS